MILLTLFIQSAKASDNKVYANPINTSLINALQQGEYIMYVRHGEATVGVDQPNLILSDCSTQRNLSREGRRQAKTYGDILRKLKIPIQYPILASPFCRTKETAELAFGSKNVQFKWKCNRIRTGTCAGYPHFYIRERTL